MTTIVFLALVCASCGSSISSVDQDRIDFVADDLVFDEPAPGTTEETFWASPAEEISGHFSPGQVTAVHSGTADLATARWWFRRLQQTGWTLTTIGGVRCDHDSYALSANKNFDDGDGVFLAGTIVVVEDRKVRLSTQITAAAMENAGGDVGEGIELTDTCLGAA